MGHANKKKRFSTYIFNWVFYRVLQNFCGISVVVITVIYVTSSRCLSICCTQLNPFERINNLKNNLSAIAFSHYTLIANF